MAAERARLLDEAQGAVDALEAQVRLMGDIVRCDVGDLTSCDMGDMM